MNTHPELNSGRSPIVVVSGLPRSGTSLAMQMLKAGGMPIVTDDLRAPDTDNPRGYMEFERVKHLKSDRGWLDDAQGKAVKIIHMLLMDLPTDRLYRVLMINRDLQEVVQSQAKMLARLGKPGASMSAERLMAVYQSQMRSVRAWLGERPNFTVCEVAYADVLADPSGAAKRIAQFAGLPLDVTAMAAAVDPGLYRNRRPAQ